MTASVTMLVLFLIVFALHLSSRGTGHVVYSSKYYPYPQKMPSSEVYPGRYLGKGTVSYLFGGRDVELYCSFRDPGIYLVSNIIWVKIDGPYPYYHYPPPYHCPYCKYRTFSADDYRYDVYQHQGKSILRIRDFRSSDQGIYRCSATSQYPYGRYTETVYKIVKV
ncbi:uncharacterized protein LOC111614734 [Centruroides sculpturatus]|uniref:uncharacterized protein LOC111614734 n=1 Tax=Centruroides sculpturatus TaxID=218467 RepID=UPI000C6E24B3|nr:uncharacterized protein LOC111614734 [Centruroides sculpturatus]